MQREDDDPELESSSGVLLAATRLGDRSALDALLARHMAPLRAFVRLQISPGLRARESESDIVQAVCIDMLEHGDRFEDRGEAAFRGWLFGAVLHKVRDRERYHRAQKRAPAHGVADVTDELLSAEYQSLCTPSRVAIAAEELRRVETAFSALPERYARVLTLARLVGLSRAELARELQMSPEAVSTLLRRATIRLSRELDRMDGAPPVGDA